MINTIATTDILTAIATVRPLVPELFLLDVDGLVVEADVVLELRLELKSAALSFENWGSERSVDEANDVAETRESDETRVLDRGGVVVVDDNKVIEVAFPILDPMVNRFMALIPEQQLPLCCDSGFADISQHINPPSAAHWFEHCHRVGP